MSINVLSRVFSLNFSHFVKFEGTLYTFSGFNCYLKHELGRKLYSSIFYTKTMSHSIQISKLKQNRKIFKKFQCTVHRYIHVYTVTEENFLNYYYFLQLSSISARAFYSSFYSFR